MNQASSMFVSAFADACGHPALMVQNLIRFVAVALVIIGVIAALNHFMGEEAKASEHYMVLTISRIVKVLIGLTLFIALLTTTKGT